MHSKAKSNSSILCSKRWDLKLALDAGLLKAANLRGGYRSSWLRFIAWALPRLLACLAEDCVKELGSWSANHQSVSSDSMRWHCWLPWHWVLAARYLRHCHCSPHPRPDWSTHSWWIASSRRSFCDGRPLLCPLRASPRKRRCPRCLFVPNSLHQNFQHCWYLTESCWRVG